MFKNFLFSFLLFNFSFLSCFPMKANYLENKIKMPNKSFLTKKFVAKDLGDFSEKTGIIEKIADKELSTSDLSDIIYSSLFYYYFKYIKRLLFALQKEFVFKIIKKHFKEIMFDIIDNMSCPYVKLMKAKISIIFLDSSIENFQKHYTSNFLTY